MSVRSLFDALAEARKVAKRGHEIAEKIEALVDTLESAWSAIDAERRAQKEASPDTEPSPESPPVAPPPPSPDLEPASAAEAQPE